MLCPGEVAAGTFLENVLYGAALWHTWQSLLTCLLSCSVMPDFATSWTVARQDPSIFWFC